jgi:hypothetical protein
VQKKKRKSNQWSKLVGTGMPFIIGFRQEDFYGNFP